MTEVTIRTDNETALQKLLDFIATVGIQDVDVRQQEAPSVESAEEEQDLSNVPIDWAEDPDIMALAGIWKDKEIDADQLRRDAWERSYD